MDSKENIDVISDDSIENIDVISDDSNKKEYVLTGAEFKKLIKNAKNLGAESLDYSPRKNNK